MLEVLNLRLGSGQGLRSEVGLWASWWLSCWSSASPTPWKSCLCSGPGGSVGGRHRNRARQRLRWRPRAEGLGKLRSEPLDDCRENCKEKWRPQGLAGPLGLLKVVQRKALGPSWVGETQRREPSLEGGKRTLNDPLDRTAGPRPAHSLTWRC